MKNQILNQIQEVFGKIKAENKDFEKCTFEQLCKFLTSEKQERQQRLSDYLQNAKEKNWNTIDENQYNILANRVEKDLEKYRRRRTAYKQFIKSLEACYGIAQTESSDNYFKSITQFGLLSKNAIIEDLGLGNELYNLLEFEEYMVTEGRYKRYTTIINYRQKAKIIEAFLDKENITIEEAKERLIVNKIDSNDPTNPTKPQNTSRRDTLKKISIGAIGGIGSLLAGRFTYQSLAKKDVIFEHYYPDSHPIFRTEIPKWIAEINASISSISIISKGQIKGGGPEESLDKLMNDERMLYHTVTYYDRDDPLLFFSGIPFGMDRSTYDLWFESPNNTALFKEYFQGKKYELYPLGNTGPQAGGWFFKPINSIEDLQNIKMRIFGVGGEVLRNISIKSNMPFKTMEDLMRSFKSKEMDKKNHAFEYVNAYVDKELGYTDTLLKQLESNTTLKLYFYKNGWQEPGTVWNLVVNQELINNYLSDEEVQQFKTITRKYHHRITNQFIVKGKEQIHKWEQENTPFEIMPSFPIPVMQELEKETIRFLKNKDQDPQSYFSRIYESYASYHLKVNGINLKL